MTDRILWHSNSPWSPVGYGVQTALFAPRIRDLGYQLAISAFYGLQGRMMVWEDIPVLPGDDTWGNHNLAAYAAYHGSGDPRGCLVITLMDVWVLNNRFLTELNLASWAPVDHDPAPPNVVAYFRQSGARPIAMSRYGQDKLREAGLDPLYVPHGVDTKVYRPLPETRELARESLSIPQDAFVVGMVANNKGFAPPRKAFPEVFEAFAEFRKHRTDAILYLHTEKMGVRGGMNLEILAESFGITDAVRWAPQTQMEIGIESESMAEIYGAIDVLANPSYGEGFGIPIMEAQACGVPVIVTDFTSMPELCGAGWKVPGERWYDAGQAAFFLRPSVPAITAAMRKAYDGAAKLKDKAVEFAAGYDADLVTTTYWKEILPELTAGRPVLEALA